MGECMYVHLENDYDDLVTNTNWHDDMIPNKCQHEKSKISQCEKKKTWSMYGSMIMYN